MEIVKCPPMFSEILSNLEVIKHEDMIWFAAMDVGKFGSETNPRKSILRHVREKHIKRYREFGNQPTQKRYQCIHDKLFVSEDGLMEYAMKLNHPLLQGFQDWVLKVVKKELKPNAIKFTTPFLPDNLEKITCEQKITKKNIIITKDPKNIVRGLRAWETQKENKIKIYNYERKISESNLLTDAHMKVIDTLVNENQTLKNMRKFDKVIRELDRNVLKKKVDLIKDEARVGIIYF